MTKTFCDRCGKEITLDNYHYFIQLTTELNRKDLGLSPHSRDMKRVFCENCMEQCTSEFLTVKLPK